MTNTHLVPFYGDKLNLIDNAGKPFVAIRPICERFGLKWSAQFVKLNADVKRWSVSIIETVGADSAVREMVCIPAHKVFSWLNTISPSKVADKVRPILERYQAECDQVLFDFWTGKLSDAAAHWKHQADSLAAELFTRKPIYARVLLLAQCGYDFNHIWKATNYSQAKVADALRFVVQMGRFPALPEGTPAIALPKARGASEPDTMPLFG